jgi:hypothetical protein
LYQAGKAAANTTTTRGDTIMTIITILMVAVIGYAYYSTQYATPRQW